MMIQYDSCRFRFNGLAELSLNQVGTRLFAQELQEKVLQAEAEHRRRIAEWQKRLNFGSGSVDERVA